MSDDATFYDQVLSRVIRFVEYDGYGRKPRNAARAIRKKFPHLSLAECEAAFDRLLAVYEEAAALVIPEPLRLGFAQSHPGLPETVTSGALSWILYWRHLR